MAYYNDIEPFPCQVLRARIADGRLPGGTVDQRSICDIKPDEIPIGTQVHLFAGIGGFALAARLAGLPDDFDIWTGGFPCQDISYAGKGAGLSGSRSGLFFEIVRLLRGVRQRPAWLLLENVPAIKKRGIDWVLSELEGLGYTCWSSVVGAGAVGSSQNRLRLFLVVHAPRSGAGIMYKNCSKDSEVFGSRRSNGSRRLSWESGGADSNVSWPSRPREAQFDFEPPRYSERVLDSELDGLPVRLVRRANKDALKAYGNSIVPQVAAMFFEWIKSQP